MPSNAVKSILASGLAVLATSVAARALDQSHEHAPDRAETAVLITWLLDEERSLHNIPFAQVVAEATGREVLPVSPENPDDQRMLDAIQHAMGQVMLEVADPAHPMHAVPRINEVSGHLEDIIREKLDATEGLVCTFPLTASGRIQRSGYPDLRLTDGETGRVFYLDPKLYRQHTESSGFRTFYYEPKTETNKILDDASHLIIGIAHEGHDGERWVITGWKLVDLYTFRVRLKAEFQASNRDLYRSEAIVLEGQP